MIYFWSDIHLFHSRIIEYCNRDFWYDAGGTERPDVDAMSAYIIKAWNRKVRDTDTIYFLGDFSFSHDFDKVKAIFDQLNGTKILIKGNHDYKEILKLGWDEIHTYYEFRHNKKKFVLFHYPIASWNNKFHGAIHIYGHVHGKSPPMTGRCLDVGFDNGFLEPVSINDVIARMDKIDFKGEGF